MGIELAYFVLGVIVYQILKILAKIVNRAVIEHRRKKVINIVQVMFPNHTKITFAAIDSSDKRSMDKIVEQLKDQGTLTEDDLDEYRMEPFPKKVNDS